VARALPDVRFAVTGRPRGDLSAWPPNLTPTGFLSDVDYWRQLARSAAIAVLTTRPETLLSGGYEALVLGRPLVTSDHAALRGYFGDAAVYAHAEAASLAGAVRAALDGADDYARRLGVLAERRRAEWEAAAGELRARLGRTP
jgi:glycosyltransferase involved in cell wall biosynthesis